MSLPLPTAARWGLPVLLLALVAGAGSGCISVKTAPIRVEPVHITVDVNLRVARELDGIFGDLDKREKALITGAPVTAAPTSEAQP